MCIRDSGSTGPRGCTIKLRVSRQGWRSCCSWQTDSSSMPCLLYTSLVVQGADARRIEGIGHHPPHRAHIDAAVGAAGKDAQRCKQHRSLQKGHCPALPRRQTPRLSDVYKRQVHTGAQRVPFSRSMASRWTSSTTLKMCIRDRVVQQRLRLCGGKEALLRAVLGGQRKALGRQLGQMCIRDRPPPACRTR